MLGVLITLVFCAGMVGIGQMLLSRLTASIDTAATIGLAGMVGLASTGTLLLFMGLVPGGLGWGTPTVTALAGVGLVQLVRGRAGLRIAKPASQEWAFIAALGISTLFALVSVLAPSDLTDWDTLSHHLASVKIWIEEGQIEPIRFMHQSNFPFAVDNLYIWGMKMGGEPGAKAFSLAFYLLGILAVFGMARQLYGRAGAWWSALLFATIPVVLWESGTAYIDVAHGLFAGLGILFAGLLLQHDEKREYLWLSGICLGFAAGTKYTGLQTMLAVGVAMLAFAGIARRPAAAKQGVLIGLVALAIASPWYVKNQIWNGNPVYPFFHSVFKGPNWDERRAAIYQNEQRTFGVGRNQISGVPSEKADPLQLGHAVLGLTYQPGRFTNPGQTQGFGDPLSAVGVPVIAVFLLALVRGRPKPAEGLVLAAAGISLVMWFVLSQQSRYITSIAPPLAIMAGGLISWPVVGAFLRVVIAGQALWTLYLFKFADPVGRGSRFDTQLQVVAGKIAPQDYREKRIPFAEPAREINELVKGGKIALYDEVFGYLLDVPYFWANPGHSTIIPYDSMQTGDDFAREMKALGFTHIYVSQVSKPEEFLNGPLTQDQKDALMGNWEIKWKALLNDALVKGHMVVVQPFPEGVVFEFVK